MKSPAGFKVIVEANIMCIPQDPPLVLYLPTSRQPASQGVGYWATAQIESERATVVPQISSL